MQRITECTSSVSVPIPIRLWMDPFLRSSRINGHTQRKNTYRTNYERPIANELRGPRNLTTFALIHWIRQTARDSRLQNPWISIPKLALNRVSPCSDSTHRALVGKPQRGFHTLPMSWMCTRKRVYSVLRRTGILTNGAYFCIPLVSRAMQCRRSIGSGPQSRGSIDRGPNGTRAHGTTTTGFYTRVHACYMTRMFTQKRDPQVVYVTKAWTDTAHLRKCAYKRIKKCRSHTLRGALFRLTNRTTSILQQVYFQAFCMSWVFALERPPNACQSARFLTNGT